MIKDNYLRKCKWRPHCPMNMTHLICPGGSFCTYHEINENNLKKGFFLCMLKFKEKNNKCKYFSKRVKNINSESCIKEGKCIFE